MAKYSSLGAKMTAFDGIVDIYEENSFDFDDAWDHGVRAIFHQTGRGTYHTDGLYAARKKTALKKGFLWGAYHLLSAEDNDLQLDAFFALQDPAEPGIALALDWEKPDADHNTMSYRKLRMMAARFNARLKPHDVDRYPILYSGNLFREEDGIVAGDALLAKCPVWYNRMRDTPLGLPKRTWPRYTLWQFDNEDRENGGPPKNVLPGADWNRFDGSFDDLKRAWPFAGGH